MAGGVVGIEVGAEVLHGGHEWGRSRVAEQAKGATGDVTGEVVDEEQVIVRAARAGDAFEDFQHPDRAFAAGCAFAA